MKSTERTIIYTLLTVLLIVNGLFVLSSTGRSALAEASTWLAELGPADALKLVDGDKELVVRNKAGRLAWGSSDFKQTYTVAFLDISKILNPLMESSALKDEREKLDKENEATDRDYRAKLEGYNEQIKNMDRNSPEGQAKIAEARKLYQEYTEWGRGALERRNQLDVQHLEKSYKELASAVDIVADKLGIDIVLRFIPPEKEFKSQDAEQALNEIRLRSAVKYPSALDITNEVMEELSIKGS